MAVSIYFLFLSILFTGIPFNFSEAALVPLSFSCKKESPYKEPVYSVQHNSIKADLTGIFCGRAPVPSGFHARLKNVDPLSASTKTSVLVRSPKNDYDFAIFDKPEVYIKENTKKAMEGQSNMWPAAMNYEDITSLIVDIVDMAKYEE